MTKVNQKAPKIAKFIWTYLSINTIFATKLNHIFCNVIRIMLYVFAKKKRLRTIRKRLQLKMGIKSQAFSVSKFEKAYLCCVKFNKTFINHTFLVKITCVFLEKGVYCISVIRLCRFFYISNYNIIRIMS